MSSPHAVMLPLPIRVCIYMSHVVPVCDFAEHDSKATRCPTGARPASATWMRLRPMRLRRPRLRALLCSGMAAPGSGGPAVAAPMAGPGRLTRCGGRLAARKGLSAEGCGRGNKVFRMWFRFGNQSANRQRFGSPAT
jgi:hypothetical protein